MSALWWDWLLLKKRQLFFEQEDSQLLEEMNDSFRIILSCVALTAASFFTWCTEHHAYHQMVSAVRGMKIMPALGQATLNLSSSSYGHRYMPFSSGCLRHKIYLERAGQPMWHKRLCPCHWFNVGWRHRLAYQLNQDMRFFLPDRC